MTTTQLLPKLLKALGALVLLFIIATIIFIDMIAKAIFEQQASQIVQAQVEVDAVDVQFFPLGVRLEALKVTNPQSPLSNAFEAELITADLMIKPLLKSKIITEHAQVKGMQFNTARSTSGAIAGLTPTSTSTSVVEPFKTDLELPKVTVASAEDLFQSSNLSTIRQADSLTKTLQDSELSWEKKLAELPDEDTLKNYKKRIKKLNDSKDLIQRLQALKDLEAIKKDFSKDLKRIKQANKDLKKDIKGHRQALKALQAAPQQDLAQLMALANLDSSAWQGLASALLGDEVGHWLERVLSWYPLIQSLLQKPSTPQNSVSIDSTDYSDGLPKFLIKELSIDGRVDIASRQWPFSGKLTNLTQQANIWGKPAELMFSSMSDSLGSFQLNGSLDSAIPNQTQGLLQLDLKNLPLKDIILSDNKDFPVTMAQAILQLAGKITFHGDNIDLNTTAQFLQVRLIDLLQDEKVPLKRALINVLQSTEQFDLNTDLSGHWQDPEITLYSSLDKILLRSIEKLISQERDQLRAKLQKMLNNEVDTRQKTLNAQLKPLLNLEEELQNRLQSYIETKVL